jgi:molybdate transport repressor ModE-like protein
MHAYKQLTLAQLRSFIEAGRRGSLAAAARALQLTHPTIWKQVHALEEQLGTRLLEATRRGCRLTDDGQALFSLVSPMIEGVDSLERSFKRRRENAPVTLRFGTSPRTLTEELPPFFRWLADREPGLRLVVREIKDTDVHTMIDTREVDVGFVAPSEQGQPRSPGLVVQPVYAIELRVAMPEGHPLAAKRRLHMNDLRGHVWLNRPELFPYEPVRSRLRELIGPEDSGGWQYQLTTASVIRDYARRGFGIGLVGSVKGTPPPPGVIEVPVSHIFGEYTIHVAYRRGALETPSIELLLRRLRDFVEQGWRAA